MSTVIAYEDKYCDQFHLLIKRLRRDRGFPGLCLESRSVLGAGGFVREVPRLLRTPLKQTKAPPDRLVCVADADKPGNLMPGAQAPPKTGGESALTGWVRSFEASWRNHIVQEAHLEGDELADRLRVTCLRWSKESLLVSVPDAVLDYAHKRGRREQVGRLLAECQPCPLTASDLEFTLHYRDPAGCMDRVFQEIADRSYKKGRDDEDLMREWISASAQRRAQLLRRCPDLDRLLEELV